MKLKGFDKFLEKTNPVFAGKRIAIIPIFFLSLFILGLLVMNGFNVLPNLLLGSGFNEVFVSILPILGVCLVCVVGFVMVYQMWFWRNRLKARYGPTAYRRIFLVGFGGIIIVLSMSVISFFPIDGAFWAVPSFNFLIVPLDSYLGAATSFVAWPRVFLGIFTTIVGYGMMLRSIFTFGFDYTTVVYLYYPEESTIQNHAIYSTLRHPMYSGGLTIALGAMIFTFTPYAIAFYFTFLLGFSIHVRFVEERELIERFGESYKEYSKKVPAFFVNPAKLKALLQFVFRPDKSP